MFKEIGCGRPVISHQADQNEGKQIFAAVKSLMAVSIPVFLRVFSVNQEHFGRG
jgi:hypothetical protein